MNKKKIESDYKKKINLLTNYNKNYYDASKPLVSDKAYDDLKNSILILESKYSFLNSEKSPSKVVGFKPSKNFRKVTHRAPMLSLANAFGREDLINFEKKILNFLSKNDDFNFSYSAEPKIDGISASLIYKNGEFKIGLSRGDGKEGEDITANLSTIKDIPKKIESKDFPEEIDIRGEVFIQNSDFENLTLAPIEKDLINFNLLTKSEKNYLFKYHLNVYSKLSKYLSPNERKWLASYI